MHQVSKKKYYHYIRMHSQQNIIILLAFTTDSATISSFLGYDTHPLSLEHSSEINPFTLKETARLSETSE